MILVRNNGSLELVDTVDLGFPVGLDEEIAKFVSQVNIHLESGDGIVLYTDGVIEAENAAGELYGLNRLTRIVNETWKFPAETIKESVVRDVLHHIGKQKMFDDLTLVILKKC
jgi:sigma-B regulation protein RsbU (phosphoserine phosphatase)